MRRAMRWENLTEGEEGREAPALVSLLKNMRKAKPLLVGKAKIVAAQAPS